MATVRPETIFADSGIAIYPKHPQFSQFLGKNAVNPLNGNLLPIFEDSRVEKDFGTGALKITPGHDLLDFAIGQDNHLPLFHAIDKTGHLTSLAGDLAGLGAKEAREQVSQKLDSLGALEKVTEYDHAVPVCERCKTPVEPLISEEWFVKMKPLAKKALENIKKIHFLPKNYLKIISDWLDDIHDWSISRSLWWGHRIPVWYCQNCNKAHQVGKDMDMVVSLQKPDKNCQSCQKSNWVQDDQVLDTWFSSGLWPLATLGWPEQTQELQKYYPWSFELSAPEIRYLWIARMIMLGLYFQNKIPFKIMFFHGTIRDLQGIKFSKSLGNGVDPLEIINQWGTDATRMVLYSYAAPGRDVKTNKQIINERAKNFRNFSTKLVNISRFIIDLKPESSAAKLQFSHSDDKWIKKELDKTSQAVTKHLEEYKLHLATEELYDFLWHKLADVYLEKTKNRRQEAQPVLEYVFETSLKLLHPFMPFITEELWQKLPHQGISIMLTPWPKADEKI